MNARGDDPRPDAAGAENEAESTPAQGEESSPDHLDRCPVCHLDFRSREPKLLPCLHSLCRKCLPPPSRNLADEITRQPLNVIRCPVCRQECMEADVMENVFAKDLVEVPSSTMERNVQLCMTCDDNMEAAGFCVDCVEYLCATCVDAHQRVKFTKDHSIREWTKEAREVRVASRRPMFCDDHKQEPLKLFCETCDLLTCRDCQLLRHKDHTYQFLEDAYENHKQHMERLVHQLEEKKKVIGEVSSSINNGLLHVDRNRASVHDAIKKSICSLILEINKKGKMLVGQLEAVTKDHESVLLKQQEDIGYLSRHLDHVIRFTKWATARNGATALLYCKRLILFQIGNLLRAKCSTSFVPQSTVRFQSRSSYWASNVDLGSVVVESVPGHQPGGFQGIPRQLSNLGQGPSGSAGGVAMGAHSSTLAQLQMQVDKLNPHWRHRAPPPPWTWYQSVQLQRTVPRSLPGGSPSNCSPSQSGRGFVIPPSARISSTTSLPSRGFATQPLRGSGFQSKPVDIFSSSPLYSRITPLPFETGAESPPQPCQMIGSSYLDRTDDAGQNLLPSSLQRNEHGRRCSPGYAAASQDEKPGAASWKPLEDNGAVGSAVNKRPKPSPEPAIVIKNEADVDGSYGQAYQRASLPDSTGDRNSDGGLGNSGTSPLWSDLRGVPQALNIPLLGGEDQHQDPPGGLVKGCCVVCRANGELLTCSRCLRGFHHGCHSPALLSPLSADWLCSLCWGSDCDDKPLAKRVKMENDAEGGLLSADTKARDEDRTAVKVVTGLAAVEAGCAGGYQSAVEFLSDIGLRLGCGTASRESDSAGEALRDLLRNTSPGQAAPGVKAESVASDPLPSPADRNTPGCGVLTQVLQNK